MLALIACSILGVPWARLLFSRLPTHGLLLATPVGFFLFHYLAWLGLFTGWFHNGRVYAWAALGVFAAISVMLAWVRRDVLPATPRARHLWTAGVAVVLVAYFIGVWMRWLNPEIAGTEKPMDLALLSGTMRSTVFPPADPWFAGKSINYYYLGYSMAGILGHLAGTPPEVTYNLYLATLLALVVVGVGAAAYDLVAMLGGTARRASQAAATSVVLGVVAGNLAIIRAIVTDEFREQTGYWQGIGWNASRVINRDVVNGLPDSTINEFPSFSFILGDLHPHLMALPFVVVVTSLVLQGIAAWWRNPPMTGPTAWVSSLLTGIFVGGLYGLNAWDLPTFLVLSIGAPILVCLASPPPRAWIPLLTHTALLLTSAVIAWLPYTLNFRMLGNGLGVVQTRTLTVDLIQVFGLAGLLALGALLTLLRPGVPSTGLRLWAGRRIGAAVRGLLRRPLVWRRAALTAFVVLLALGHGLATAEAVGPLVVLLGLAIYVMVRQRRELGPFSLALVVSAALGLILLAEIAYIDDFFGPPYTRMNTVFKVHYQAWVLLAIAAGPSLYVTLCAFDQWRHPIRSVVRSGYVSVVVLLTVAALSYPAVALRTKAAASEVSGSLDGLALADLRHADDLAAARWLADNADDSAVVLEAPGAPYSGDSRLSTWSGVPTLIGWDQHEELWRGHTAGVRERKRDADLVYTTSQATQAVRLLHHYEVTHVAFGRAESARYGTAVGVRLHSFLTPVAKFGATTIFVVPVDPK